MTSPRQTRVRRSRHRLTAASVLAVALGLALPQLRAGPRTLFLDPALLTETNRVTLAVNPPHSSEPVIKVERPWEARMISFYTTVIEENDKLRLWYICRDADNRPNLAYAESRDGRTWTKPNLGIVEYRGSRENNLVGITSLDGAVFRDPNGSPNKKYVYVAHVAAQGVFRFASPDGLRWRRDPKPLLPFRADTQNVVTWDEATRRYAVYLRAWEVGAVWTERMRKVARLEISTLAEPAGIRPSGRGANPDNPRDLPRIADEIPTVLAADAADPQGTDVYTLAAQRYPLDPRWHVGFPSFFRRDKNISDGRLEVQFVGSRDGIAWHRYDRAPFVRPGLDSSAVANMAFIGPGIVVRGDELWLFGTGFKHRHGDVEARRDTADGTIFRHAMRVDAFVALTTGNDEGWARTVPVRVTGRSLLLNLDTGALGALRVALLDAAGQPIAGFETARCDRIETNSVGAKVTWSGAADLSALLGRDVCIEFRSTRTKLFSFRFE